MGVFVTVMSADKWRDDPVMAVVGAVLYGPAIGWVVVKLVDAVGWVAASLFEADIELYPLPWHDSNFDHFASVMQDYPKDELMMIFLARRWSFRTSLLIAGIVALMAGRLSESVLGHGVWVAVPAFVALLTFGITLAVLYFPVADVIFGLMSRLAKKKERVQ